MPKDTVQQPESLTVKEAIELGYKYYSREGDEVYSKLAEAGDDDSLATDELFLVSKEPTFLTVDGEDIYGDLAENFAINNDVYDDDDSYGDLIRGAYDWEHVVNVINAALKAHPVYYATKIILKP